MVPTGPAAGFDGRVAFFSREAPLFGPPGGFGCATDSRLITVFVARDHNIAIRCDAVAEARAKSGLRGVGYGGIGIDVPFQDRLAGDLVYVLPPGAPAARK